MTQYRLRPSHCHAAMLLVIEGQYTFPDLALRGLLIHKKGWPTQCAFAAQDEMTNMFDCIAWGSTRYPLYDKDFRDVSLLSLAFYAEVVRHEPHIYKA